MIKINILLFLNFSFEVGENKIKYYLNKCFFQKKNLKKISEGPPPGIMYKGGVGNKTTIQINLAQRVFNIYRLCSKICINSFVYYCLRIFLASLGEDAKKNS